MRVLSLATSILESMKFKTLFLWWIINSEPDKPSPDDRGELTPGEKSLESAIQLLDTLFPGQYSTVMSIGAMVEHYAIPVLQKRFPELVGVAFESIDPRAMIEVGTFLPTRGWEWMDSLGWSEEFRRRMAEA